MKTVFLLLLVAVVALCIDQADFFSTDSGPVRTTPIYNASMMLEGSGKVIHVDPTSQANYKGLPKADLILITQDNPEHLDPAQIAKISKKTTAILAPSGPAGRLQHCTAMNNGDNVGFGDISIEAVAAYTLPEPGSNEKPAHEKGQGNGYVVTFPGFRIYISGDTSFVPELKKLKNVELAFLSIGPPDGMSLEDAASLIRTLKPKTVYPDHYRKMNVDEIRKGLAVPGTEIRMRYWY